MEKDQICVSIAAPSCNPSGAALWLLTMFLNVLVSGHNLARPRLQSRLKAESLTLPRHSVVFEKGHLIS